LIHIFLLNSAGLFASSRGHNLCHNLCQFTCAFVVVMNSQIYLFSYLV